jgi:glycosyltransferase involved in cell wall biosynthesis
MKVALVSNSLGSEQGGQSKFINDLKFQAKNSQDSLFFVGNSKFFFETLFSTLYFIKNSNIVHIVGLWSFYNQFVNLSALLLKKPIIISTLGMADPWSLKQKFIKKKIAFYLYQKFFLEKANIIHCTSIDEKKNLKKIGIKNKIVSIPHGILIKKNSPNYKKYKNKKILLFISRIHKKKGIFSLIDAFKLIKNKHWHLNIVGFGEKNNIALLKAKIKNHKKIKFYGQANIDKTSYFYKRANVTILPSYSENFGYVIAESLSFGTPVATTANTPWRFIKNKKIGYIIDPEVEKLTTQLQFIFNSSINEQKKMGLNGFKYVYKHFNLKKIYIKYLSLYKTVLAKN